MRRREFVPSLVGGIVSWWFATWPSLTAPDGTAVAEQTYRGKWLVIYFGYTFCPDICPTTMMEIAGALKTLGPRANLVQTYHRSASRHPLVV